MCVQVLRDAASRWLKPRLMSFRQVTHYVDTRLQVLMNFANQNR
jgi:hypothetical protein